MASLLCFSSPSSRETVSALKCHRSAPIKSPASLRSEVSESTSSQTSSRQVKGRASTSEMITTQLRVPYRRRAHRCSCRSRIAMLKTVGNNSSSTVMAKALDWTRRRGRSLSHTAETTSPPSESNLGLQAAVTTSSRCSSRVLSIERWRRRGPAQVRPLSKTNDSCSKRQTAMNCWKRRGTTRASAPPSNDSTRSLWRASRTPMLATTSMDRQGR